MDAQWNRVDTIYAEFYDIAQITDCQIMDTAGAPIEQLLQTYKFWVRIRLVLVYCGMFP